MAVQFGVTQVLFWIGITTATVLALVLGEARGVRPLVWAAKIAASSTFVAAAVWGGCLSHPYGRWIFVALGLCWLGDLLLLPRSKRSFLGGLFAFLMGHLAFVVAFVVRGVEVRWTLLCLAVLCLPLYGLGRWLLPKVGSGLRAPVLAYMIVISAMVASSLGTVAARGEPVLVVAALAFYLSDLCVARDRFVTSSWINRAVGLPLYFGAQLAFALSSWA